jgi:RNA polymerase sigma factor for flagellar operon FliA
MSLKRTQTVYASAARQSLGRCLCPTGERNALVEANLPQVKFIAERMAAKLPPSVDRDDLIGAGVLGLMDAVDKFDPARGVQFKTYAELRVRGAILDSLRSLDWAPRSMRHRGREVEAAYHQIEQERGRAAQEDEVATRLGLSAAEFSTLLNELRGLTLMGLEADDEDSEFQAPQIPDDLERGPLALYERGESRSHLIAAIDRLPDRERQVVALYYLEELTMKEVGAVLGVTESRVSQLHTQAVLRLRAALSQTS